VLGALNPAGTSTFSVPYDGLSAQATVPLVNVTVNTCPVLPTSAHVGTITAAPPPKGVLVGVAVGVNVGVFVGVFVDVGDGASTFTEGEFNMGMVFVPLGALSTVNSAVPALPCTVAPGPVPDLSP
jgi:hypothetical protein